MYRIRDVQFHEIFASLIIINSFIHYFFLYQTYREIAQLGG